ncbi:UDP-N-acetylmuramate dehydrogenase [Vibrio ostreicida]|uniref:UDP-N-acetylmuramate dehydrogenase n=1 Tax=Vibrio ostreicida TaxID=526588 RepID=UPI000970A9B1|nr:UDP-N-acetylmuramate dehydrogenase [Vibrio ostreicida]
MQILSNADLSHYHTFSLPQSCDYLAEVSSIEELKQLYQHSDYFELPKLILGRGSNVLFTERFEGVVIVNRIMGKQVTESKHDWHLHINAGEDWPSLVLWSIEQEYSGLENLALIPGCVGSAPIQNIGAYGMELKDVCEYVDVLNLENNQIERMTASECQFGYRDSIFKHQLYQKVVIVAIGLKLAKTWRPNIAYGPLQSFDPESVTAQQIYQRVSEVRMEKLPDPQKVGNAGSFFKNPVLSKAQHDLLKAKLPNLVSYPTQNGMKIAAGWLIEQCGLKGTVVGGGQVHPKQALVIVNRRQASASDIVQLAVLVRQTVEAEYDVKLEHEVRFIGKCGEMSLDEILQVAR